MKFSEWRAKARLSLDRIARALGVSHETVRNWDRNTVYPSEENLRKIIELTGGLVTDSDFVRKSTKRGRPAKVKAA
ncbi:MAG: helix-turn-helix transcriptional regulator [Candidatus Methanomethylicaceae archaeon]